MSTSEQVLWRRVARCEEAMWGEPSADGDLSQRVDLLELSLGVTSDGTRTVEERLGAIEHLIGLTESPYKLCDLFCVAAHEVCAACLEDSRARRAAWMGDARLKALLSQRIMEDAPPSAGAGELTRARQRLEANTSLAWFMRLGTDLPAAYMQNANSRSDHTLGTVFEALLEAAAPEQRASAVAIYADWVEARLDANLVVSHVEHEVADTGEMQEVSCWQWLPEDQQVEGDGQSLTTVLSGSDVSTQAGIRATLLTLHELHEHWAVEHDDNLSGIPEDGDDSGGTTSRWRPEGMGIGDLQEEEQLRQAMVASLNEGIGSQLPQEMEVASSAQREGQEVELYTNAPDGRRPRRRRGRLGRERKRAVRRLAENCIYYFGSLSMEECAGRAVVRVSE